MMLSNGISIANFRKEQMPMIALWWKANKEVAPELELMPEESSFVLSIAGVPSMVISCFLTNTPVAWLENLVQNPELKKLNAKMDSLRALVDHVEQFCRGQGKRILFCMSIKSATGRRYRQMGFSKTSDQLSTWIKEIN